MQTLLEVRRSFSWHTAMRARYAALPPEHGAWVFLLSPLIIGLAQGGVSTASLVMVVAALAAFLVRQPVTIAVKILAGRRPKNDLGAAIFWLVMYGIVGLVAATVLLVWGYGFVFWLALPALPIFAWHLWLVGRRAERRQMLVEIIAAGVLALAAPAALWVGKGQLDSGGWLLWGLCWAQVAGTIVYAYLRLEQRQLKQYPDQAQALRMAAPALAVNLMLLVVVAALAAARVVPALLPVAYLIQPLEAIWGATHPAVGVKPKVIGFRQLFISSLFTLTFILIASLSPG